MIKNLFLFCTIIIIAMYADPDASFQRKYGIPVEKVCKANKLSRGQLEKYIPFIQNDALCGVV